ncbi:MAG: hypothetical protein H7Z41_01115, partial [Cytophagales bacterium]|nr:hypothetical protein [Armatimonadota bacterium]
MIASILLAEAGAAGVAAAPSAAPSPAAAREFTFSDPKGINAVTLMIDSLLEPITGYANDVSGSLLFDPSRPETASGKILVAVASIQFSNDGYTDTARGYAL